MKLLSLFSVVVALLSLGCATTERPNVASVANTAPAVSASVKQAAVDAKTGVKRKVAISRFTNESKYGQSFFIDKATKDRLGKQASDILSAKLLATAKFIMLERIDLDKIQDELKIGNAGEYKNMADYMIVGSVTEFGRKDVGEVGVFSRTKRQVAFARVHIRLVEIATGQVIYAEEGTGEAYSEVGSVMGVGSTAGYDTSLNDKAIDAAITNLASNVIENLLERPWKGYILTNEGGQYLISGGKSQGIRAGDTFDVMGQGRKVRNPQTNMEITLPGSRIGKLRVVSTLGDTPESEVSLCQLTEGSLASFDATQDYAQVYIQEIKR